MGNEPAKPSEPHTTTNIAEMTADELERHIAELDTKHRARLKTLRALARARRAEEEAK